MFIRRTVFSAGDIILEEKLMYCEKCGKIVSNTEKVCPKCGHDSFTDKRRGAKFKPSATAWMVISFIFNLALGAAYFILGVMGQSPDIELSFANGLTFEIVNTGFNICLVLIGAVIILYSFVYLILLSSKKQFLYGVLMVTALCVCSFYFFFYGGSVLGILMIPVMVVFPMITKLLIGDEWDYMG